MQASAARTLRIINKCLWKPGAEDVYKASWKESVRSSCKSQTRRLGSYAHSNVTRKQSSNPMLNGVSMLQWFFDEVRPDQREVRYWMKYFSQVNDPKHTFAVIQVTEDVFLQEQLDQIAKTQDKLNRSILETLSLSLYFLQQNKMNVILLVGTSDLSQASDNKKKREMIYKNVRVMVDKLEESGVKTIPIFDGGQIFNTNSLFRIESVNTSNVDWLTSHGSIPVIGCIGENDDGVLGPLCLDDGAHFLSLYTQPLKILLLNSLGGIRDQNSQRLTTVFLPAKSELRKYEQLPWWNKELEQRFSMVCDLLSVLPKNSSYVITSAKDLLGELLTQRGVGTMFKKVVPVSRYQSLNDVVTLEGKEKRLIDIVPSLLDSAFEKATLQTYWDSLPERLNAIYLTDDLKTCAIVMNFPELPSVYYLDKFAVLKEERGNFNTEVLWQQLKHDYKSLFWRSRHNNIFNSWYEARSDGCMKLGYYHVYWYGMTARDITAIVNECSLLPSSFKQSA